MSKDANFIVGTPKELELISTAGNVEWFIDGISLGTSNKTIAPTLGLNIGRRIETSGSYSSKSVIDIEFTDNASSSNSRLYDANASVHTSGTPILSDTANSNDATGVNMPTAALGQPGSAWVDLGSSGITITALLNSNYMVEYSMKKNVASQSIGAQMVTISDGSNFTGTVTAEVTIDNGTKTAGGGTVTHEGEGYHSYAPTQAETNGDHVAVSFAGTGALTQTIQVYTTFPQTVDNDTKISLIPTTAMRGTDSAATASQVAALNNFNPSSDAVANVTLVATTTTNTDMVGTNDALLAASYTAPDNSGISQTQVDIAALNNISVSQILTTQMTESYSADGVAPTLAQSLFLTMQNLQDYTYIGTVQTVKKIDGSTTAATYTLDDAINPTSKTRAT